MSKYIDAHRERFGVEPICSALQVAPSTYYAATTRPPSPRSRSDALLKPELVRVHAANYGVYGVRKLWRQLAREGVTVGRDRVHRLMQELGHHRRRPRQADAHDAACSRCCAAW